MDVWVTMAGERKTETDIELHCTVSDAGLYTEDMWVRMASERETETDIELQ